MNNIACLSRGYSIDYKRNEWIWDQKGSEQAFVDKVQQYINLDSKFNLAVIRVDSVRVNLLVTVKTKNQVFSGQYTSGSVIFFDLNEETARKLAVAILRSRGKETGLCGKIASAFQLVDDQNYGYTVNFQDLRDVFDSEEISSVDLSAISEFFPEALELPWEQTAEERLVNDVIRYRFSDGVGAKIVLTDAPPDSGWKRAQNEADRLIWEGAQARDLKKERNTSIQKPILSTKSGEPVPISKLPDSQGYSTECLSSEVRCNQSTSDSKKDFCDTLSRNWKAATVLGILLVSLMAILFLIPKKKAQITKIEPYGMPSPALIVHFDRPMDTATFPEIQIGPNGLGVEKMKWLNPTEMKVELALPDVIEVQIKGARAADGGGIVPYRERISLEKPTK